jgi:hypothetical protein
MKRLRLATWAAVASLGLVAGCQSPCCECNGCSNGCGLFSGRLMDRLRPRCCCETVSALPAASVPVESLPVSTGIPHAGMTVPGGCPNCVGNGAGMPLPPSGDVYVPDLTSVPGPGLPAGPPPLPPGAIPMPAPGPQSNTTLPPGATTLPPPGMLPAPAPVPGTPQLSPPPNGGLATPTPATPSSRAQGR